jgi:hypothetical protein
MLRKTALELNASKDDCELRSIFEFVCGMPTGITFFRLLNDRLEAWTHLFTTTCNTFLSNNTKPLMINSNGTNAYFKHMTSK